MTQYSLIQLQMIYINNIYQTIQAKSSKIENKKKFSLKMS